ncbi:hypothetical protein [Methanosarcina sp. MSH10X1]|nr:hypothetical protein [Methanosarcina sp. MSH10X1]
MRDKNKPEAGKNKGKNQGKDKRKNKTKNEIKSNLSETGFSETIRIGEQI